MKFAAVALLATTAQAADPFLCGNWTVETFTDKACATNDTNETKTALGKAWAASMTTTFAAAGNCTAVVGESNKFHISTCNQTHYTLSAFKDNKCTDPFTVVVSGNAVPAKPDVYEFGTCAVEGAAPNQYSVKASWKSAKALMAGSAAALAVAATLY